MWESETKYSNITQFYFGKNVHVEVTNIFNTNYPFPLSPENPKKMMKGLTQHRLPYRQCVVGHMADQNKDNNV